MPDYVQYRSEDGRILATFRSADPAQVAGRPNVMQVTRSTLDQITKYHRVDGEIVRAMTQPERDALDAELLAASRDTQRAQIDAGYFEMADLVRAIDGIARSAGALPLTGSMLTGNAIKARVKADKGL